MTMMLFRPGLRRAAVFHAAGAPLAGRRLGSAAAAARSASHASAVVANRSGVLRRTLLASNWEDPVVYVQNIALWEDECNELHDLALEAGPKLAEESVDELKAAKNALECYVKCADVRDHIAELMEHASRHAGIAGTGHKAEPAIANMEEHAACVDKIYGELQRDYPELRANIEDSVGRGLALLRQKMRFDFSHQHKFFF